MHAVESWSQDAGKSWPPSAWVPEAAVGDYRARASVGRNLVNERQVLTLLELDIAAEEFGANRRN